ncbi:MAG: hypothetical protein DMG06_27310 [Acidobacteria bacterium]|nr:MAG: hypothetical protein DMG06_27310 [Acidobacteriota bacterium]
MANLNGVRDSSAADAARVPDGGTKVPALKGRSTVKRRDAAAKPAFHGRNFVTAGIPIRVMSGKRSVSIRSLPEGDEYAEAFGIYPLQGIGKVPRLLSQGSGWTATGADLWEREASLHEISIEQRNA